MEHIDIAIVGAGASGLAAAYRLGERYPSKDIFVFEKNKEIGDEQSGHNSGVDHSRYQYHPNSLKSRLRGFSPVSLKEFSLKHGIFYKTVGKLIVANTDDLVKELKFFEENARTAGVPIEYLTREQVKEKEPNVECLAALHTPTTGIVDAAKYVRTLGDLVEKQGGNILKGAPVINLKPDGNKFIVEVKQGNDQYEFGAEMVINAAGLFADELARKINPEFPYFIKPLRGEYMKFNKTLRKELFTNMCVYPVPAIIHGMFDEHGRPKRAAGTHLTPIFDFTGNISNNVWVGPLHSVVKDKSDYHKNRKGKEEFVKDIPFFQIGR